MSEKNSVEKKNIKMCKINEAAIFLILCELIDGLPVAKFNSVF